MDLDGFDSSQGGVFIVCKYGETGGAGGGKISFHGFAIFNTIKKYYEKTEIPNSKMYGRFELSKCMINLNYIIIQKS